MSDVKITFPEEMRAKLEERNPGMELSEIFREAVKVHLLLKEEMARGTDLLLRDKDGNMERLVLNEANKKAATEKGN